MTAAGVYDRTCQVVMNVLRRHHDILLSVMETFVHDPLVEWSKPTKNHHNIVLNQQLHHPLPPVNLKSSIFSSTNNLVNDQARRVLLNIRNKLKGGLGLTCLYNQVRVVLEIVVWVIVDI